MPVVPHTSPPRWPEGALDPGSGRYASTVATGSPDGCRVAILGLADDLGIRLNRGRPGAAEGPAAFRAALARYGTAKPDDFRWPRVFDAGDVTPAPGDGPDALAETHDRVTEATLALLDLGLLPIGIGGGHDLTFPLVRAVAQRSPHLRGVYFDPHLDVRAEPGSGMPFRAILEQTTVRSVEIYGFSPLVNSNEHFTWFSHNRGRIGGDLQEVLDDHHPDEPERDHDLFVSLDLDVIDMAHAPGVSAMNPCGWTSREAEAAVFATGACDRVRCFDIMELSPPHDQGGRTARLAAHLFLTFLRGLTDRPGWIGR